MSRLVASDLPSGVLHEDVEIYKETRKRAINVMIKIVYICFEIFNNIILSGIEYSTSSRVYDIKPSRKMSCSNSVW